MTKRAVIILIEAGKIALIERHRQGVRYFTFPGGHIEADETPEETAEREAEEELGLKVVIGQQVAEIWWHGRPQYYYLAETVEGAFGTGRGEEMTSPLPERGTYRPVWVPLDELLSYPILPRRMAEIIVKATKNGWPEKPALIYE
ncbi:MAG: NUDIX domain-containing protein [Chloroflexota bacterium]